MTKIYELMGLPYFGAAGSVEVSALLTKVFKSIQHVPLIGFFRINVGGDGRFRFSRRNTKTLF